jgi:arabinogalactan endo-1,4-beta-galactosidase
MRKTLRMVLATSLVWVFPPTALPAAFVHPGLLHTRADLDRVKQRVQQGAELYQAGFEKLRTHPQSQSDWRLRGPFDRVSRGAGQELHRTELAQDGNAAYQNALMWAITGDKAHAQKAVEILNAWSGTLKEIVGRDKELAASLCGFKYVNAAEIIRYTYDGWAPAEIERCETMLKGVFYPVIKDFATFANGNWDTGCIKTMMAIGVFCNDQALYDRAVDYYRSGSGNGRLTHYIINGQGQCQESGRDQTHVQLGLAHLAETCEIAWSQGLDLYGAADNRLLKGFEYTAKFNLGQEVPFAAYRDTTGKYFAQAISSQRRGLFRPIFEMVWNHYENRKGIPAPYTKQAAERIRPEGAAFDADHPGFGTLLFTLPARSAPVRASEETSSESRVQAVQDRVNAELQTADYAIGADLSFLKQAEDRGTVFKDNGQAKPGLQIFHDHGYNWIRLRLFHTPTRLPNSLDYTIALAKDAKKLGFKFLLDYHYSDTWADPGKQTIPKAWEGKSHAEIVQAVREYTRDTIITFREAGVLPDMVQPGNEITPGMLWPDGKLPANWDNFAELLKAAIEGVDAGRSDAPRPRIMIHIDKGGNKNATKGFFDKLNSYGVPYDVIGQSFYPWWHGSLADLRENLAFMAHEYRKDIIVVEAAYNWRPTEYKNKEAPFPETPQGQRQFLAEVNRIVLETPHGLGKGVFWWEPAVTGGLRSRGFFDDDGNALPVITVFDEFTKR